MLQPHPLSDVLWTFYQSLSPILSLSFMSPPITLECAVMPSLYISPPPPSLLFLIISWCLSELCRWQRACLVDTPGNEALNADGLSCPLLLIFSHTHSAQKHTHPDGTPHTHTLPPLQAFQSTPGLNNSWRCFKEDKRKSMTSTRFLSSFKQHTMM